MQSVGLMGDEATGMDCEINSFGTQTHFTLRENITDCLPIEGKIMSIKTLLENKKGSLFWGTTCSRFKYEQVYYELPI